MAEHEEEEEEEEQPLEEARRDAVYDVDGLRDKLEDIAWDGEVGWIHSLSVSVPMDEGGVSVEDDLAREMCFYTQALEGAREAYSQLQELGAPFLRPSDYYAEMVKSDTHMLKVKDRLLSDKKQIEEEQERRKAREAKKYAKEVQAEKMKERARQKKHDFESVKKWRKMRKDSDFTQGEDDFPVDAPDAKPKRNAAAPWDRSGGKKLAGHKSKSRQQRDAKFGYGGRKGLSKKNTADSAAGGLKRSARPSSGPQSFKKQRRK
ncbi:hypothetical protein SELMODRAFT_175633 [Selaginella moellendorffii]|uniref:Uncharacterized protein n=1 Tax=Selaginella moellendorffii TaxID=88036 RepID=D8RZE5_SELML|nr:probable rRNA-processing protein EBP2 homolog [Selaginella moellendorffii]EFJ22597.1 hypothetical protein SELMODRAFT_175633 [Selaginella moellendorffii]|eukprot:XP_002976337.1 probable rRNA-processing protein EBP2 homolog [Selaginella moellendorffii]